MAFNLRQVYAFAREYHQKRDTQKDVQYGTAGFRSHADNLDYVMYRMGLLAVIRSRAKGGQVIGVMITASHNPEQDNGVKLIDPMGEMLEQRWEKLATDMVNVSDVDLEAQVAKICADENIDNNNPAKVFVGMDTRYHSPQLAKAVLNGVAAMKGSVRDFGIVTTPMLHYFVTCSNTDMAYGLPTEEGYMHKLLTAFKNIRGTTFEKGSYVNKVFYDGANGVGSLKMLGFVKKLDGYLDVKVFNSNGKINFNCGADFVKTNQRAPEGMPELEPNARCVSVDGDADRIVYYFTDEEGVFHLLDGDRIATLIAGYLKDLVEKCGVARADDKAEMNSTSESGENVKENDQNADGELESIVIKEEAIVQSEPDEDGVKESGQTHDQNVDEELVSIIIKEKVFVQSGNAATSWVRETAGMQDNPLNTNERSEQGVMIEIKQEPLDNGEAETSTVLTECEKSRAEEGTSEQKSTLIEEQKVDFVEATNESTKEPKTAENPEPLAEQHAVSTESDAEEKPGLLLLEALEQAEQMDVDETIDKFTAETPTHRGHRWVKCEDCGLDFSYRRRLEEHRERYHSPTSTEVLKIINCPYCPKLFISASNRTHHIATKHVQTHFKINCAQCPMQVTDAVQLRKHYKTVHPEYLVTFKCPECWRSYLNLSSLKVHYKKHRKETEAHDKREVESTSESIEEGVKESGQTNDQTVDAELESIVIKEEAMV